MCDASLVLGKDVSVFMANWRRRFHGRELEDETVELGDVLEPYDSQPAQEDDYYPEYQEMYQPPMYEEDPDQQEEEDSEGHFRIAMGVFDMISILIGAVVILVLVALLVTLVNWLRTDILHSALLLQSGLQ